MHNTYVLYRGGLERSQLLVAVSLFCAQPLRDLKKPSASFLKFVFFSLRLFILPLI